MKASDKNKVRTSLSWELDAKKINLFDFNGSCAH